ncbi:hypothetical protein C5167_042188 [Papaver somniferum]|uniref:Uncharacterized protein n=1 Tax=Papaver somniferum TaxID=3469 RepID=A0A4Y7L4Q5_PAPSO|nr:hypothetical protein C5167_042188 [Papaver somniferum]
MPSCVSFTAIHNISGLILTGCNVNLCSTPSQPVDSRSGQHEKFLRRERHEEAVT